MKYTIVFTKKVTLVQQAYFHKLNNSTYNTLVKYQKIVKTQFKRVIKKWHIDGGKEYSLKKLVKFIDNLEQVVKFTILYNLKQDSIFK